MKPINRRQFLQNSSLIAGSYFALPATSLAFEPQKNFNSIQVKGKLSARGKGISNVAVSDGKYIYYTDSSGNFEFKTDRSFVFFSYPSGYRFNILENGSVDFFRKLDFGKAINEVHFELTPNPNSEKSHHFITIADPQVQSAGEADQFIKESCSDLRKTVERLQDPNTFGIGLGDLVFDEFELFEKYNQGIKSTGIPFFQVLGNHDIDLQARGNESSQYPFSDQYGPAYYSFNRGGKHYVVLSDVFFLGNKQYYGYLDETQLHWLEQDLKHVEKGSELVVFLHIPTYSNVVSFNSGRDINKESVINREVLYSILKDYKVHLISGHVHWNENNVNTNIFEHNTAAISGAWWTADFCYDGSPKGYGVYQMKENLSWHYQAIGEESSHQFRLYNPGAHPDFPEEYCVNIWNWDPEWKVYWKENGVRMGEARQEVTYDPKAIQLFTNRPADAKHPWISPQRNAHMFFFHPNSTQKTVEIEVIDRFGQIYREKIH